MRPQVVYLLSVVFSTMLLGALSLSGWRRRHAVDGLRFAIFGAAAAAWSLLVGAMAVSPPHVARALLPVKYLAIGGATVSSFLLIAGHTGRLRRLGTSRVALFMIIPIAATILSWRDGWGMIDRVAFAVRHGLTFPAAISFGPVYWVHTGYLYTLILCSIAFLVRSRRGGAPLVRAQSTPLLIGVLAPFLTNVLLITGIAPPLYDPMPVGSAFTGVALWWGILRRRMLDLVPVARQALVDSLQEGILIVDADGRIVDLNRRLADVAGWDAARVLGRTLAESSTSEPSLHAALCAAVAESPGTDDPASDRPPPRPPLPASGDAEALREPAVVVAGRSFDVRSFVVAPSDRSRTGQPGAARVVVLHDVTERQQWEDEQARLITELQSALRQVKTLRGLLPICAGCKQIRDDVGRWHPLEEYLHERTEAQFSHGMCPACVEQWYPGVLASPPSPP